MRNGFFSTNSPQDRDDSQPLGEFGDTVAELEIVAARTINAAFEDGSVNERAIRYWYAKFESDDESLTNKDRDRAETVVDNEVLQTIVEQNPGNTDRDFAEGLGEISTTISRINKKD
ncbi:hypothetical protein TNCV_2480741 [Trichonephila clavipes]|nr:hypothetical protein TNCV_2480741 [Trichonephila clavipes]